MKPDRILTLLLCFFLFSSLACKPPSPPQDLPTPPEGQTVQQAEPAVEPFQISPGAATETPGSDTMYVAEGADGQVTTSITPDPSSPVTSAADGSSEATTITSGIPDNWPESVPIMPGLTVVWAVDTMDQPDDPGITLSLAGTVSLVEISDFYNKLEGWTRDESVLIPTPTESGFILALLKDDTEKLDLTGGTDDDGNSIVNMLYTTGRR